MGVHHDHRRVLTPASALADLPAERTERAERARAALAQWNGYAPSAAEERDLDSELVRRLARVTGQ
ncbi:hypothetical protein OOZ58_44075 [Streptomyces tauricus]|nr:hypothetical protein [Streptomyces tauricus]MCW8103430.1 hypothetical protein [Streptomyces tauricus]